MTNPTRDHPHSPVSIALALLDRHWPISPALSDQADVSAASEMEKDPRYLIGRLQQALTTLLSSVLPPMDTETSLLSQAIADAIAWRRHDGRGPCPRCAHSLCAACNADWDQVDRYHALARALGAVGTPPSPSELRNPAATDKERVMNERMSMTTGTERSGTNPRPTCR
jgi:hypothetical protein